MPNVTFNFPDKEELSLLIKDALRELIPELSQQTLVNERPPITYLTRGEIVKKYRISLVTLHSLTKKGLPSIKIGKRRLYDSDIIESYFNKKRML